MSDNGCVRFFDEVPSFSPLTPAPSFVSPEIIQSKEGIIVIIIVILFNIIITIIFTNKAIENFISSIANNIHSYLGSNTDDKLSKKLLKQKNDDNDDDDDKKQSDYLIILGNIIMVTIIIIIIDIVIISRPHPYDTRSHGK